MVERNLAKVEVASSNLVSRSKYPKASRIFISCLPFLFFGAIAKRLCPGLQIRLDQFDSGSRLQTPPSGYFSNGPSKRPLGLSLSKPTALASPLPPSLRPRSGIAVKNIPLLRHSSAKPAPAKPGGCNLPCGIQNKMLSSQACRFPVIKPSKKFRVNTSALPLIDG